MRSSSDQGHGSIIGPLLFLIYIKYDLPISPSICLFVDDTNIYCGAESLNLLQQTLNKEVKKWKWGWMLANFYWILIRLILLFSSLPSIPPFKLSISKLEAYSRFSWETSHSSLYPVYCLQNQIICKDVKLTISLNSRISLEFHESMEASFLKKKRRRMQMNSKHENVVRTSYQN